MPGGELPEMLTTAQAARLLNVDRTTIARWVRFGQLPATRLPSGQLRVSRRVVERMLAQAGEDVDQERR